MMDVLSAIIGIVLVAGYICAAFFLIRSCETRGGTIAGTAAAIGGGVLLAVFIEYIIAFCILILALYVLYTIFG